MPAFTGLEILYIGPDADYIPYLKEEITSRGLFLWESNSQSQVEELLYEKFFSVVIIDLDALSENGGLDTVVKVKEKSPGSFVILAVGRKCSPKRIVKAYTNGCDECVLTNKVENNFLAARVIQYATQKRYQDERDVLLQSILKIHHKFFKNLMALHIRVMDLEENLSPSSLAEDYVDFKILVVETASELYPVLRSEFPQERGWSISNASLGSEVLSSIGDLEVDFALVNSNLPDLPGTTVANALKTNFPNSHCYVFDNVPGESGPLDIFEIESVQGTQREGHFTPSDAKLLDLRKKHLSFSTRKMMFEHLLQYRDEVAMANRKKHYSQTFKAQHFDFINEYTKIRNRIEKIFQFMI
ncbi:MAG: hypothetical protein JXR95_10915 [Deltaproteobacteria bacterium]|nr:hypothetical protein [Deltaproteobacteria bacterium]